MTSFVKNFYLFCFVCSGAFFTADYPGNMLTDDYKKAVVDAMQELVDEGIWKWLRKAELMKKGEMIDTETVPMDYLFWSLQKN